MRRPSMPSRAWRAATAFMLTLGLALLGGIASAPAATQFGTYGSEAGHTVGPVGVAVDSGGGVYVGDMENNRTDKFDSAGSWLLAWGVGVLTGAPEMQTCTSECLKGKQVGSQEAFALPTGVAVDDDPLSGSYGDVYAVDYGHDRVEKFHPEDVNGQIVMRFVLMLGGEVNEANGEDVCRAGEKCKLYAKPGSADGEFSFGTEAGAGEAGFYSFIAVGVGGAVYVGDKARVEVFEPSGAWRQSISLAGLSSTGFPTALAVDSAGDVFVKDSEVSGVREFAPNGTEVSATLDENSTTVTALAVDQSTNHVFIGDSSGGFHIDEYDLSGRELASFHSEPASGQNRGLAFSSVTGELYATESPVVLGTERRASVWELPPPSLAPQIASESVTSEPRGGATLEAQVNPEGNETTVHFEYVDEAHFKQSGYAAATSTAPVSIGSSPSFEAQLVTAHLTLVPGTGYHYRAVASSSAGSTTGEDESFLETPPALISVPSISNVAATSATIATRIDPLGASTIYRLEYGSGASYDHSVSGSVGEGTAYVAVIRHLQELQPSTTYHFRVVTSNEVGTWQTADQSFTTQTSGGELVLPDGRAWELVSPANKHNALIMPELLDDFFGGMVQAAADGSGLAYTSTSPVTEGAPAFTSFIDQVLTRRSAAGWRSEEIILPQRLAQEEGAQFQQTRAELPDAFSADLSLAAIEPADIATLLSAEATEQTLYLRDNPRGVYVPLLTSANVPAGTKFAGSKQAGTEMHYLAATPDLRHILFQSPLALTKDALPAECRESGFPPGAFTCDENLYEWSAGQLQLVNVLPNNSALRPAGKQDSVGLGRWNDESAPAEDTQYSVSRDGRFVVWSDGENSPAPTITHTMYVRDTVKGETVSFGGPHARFDAISADGSRVLYWEGGDLYELSVPSNTQIDITGNHGPGEATAGVIDRWWMGPSEDGQYVYFVATGVLAAGGVSGEDNLYLAHDDGSEWAIVHIATLSNEDKFQEAEPNSTGIEMQNVDSRVSPNGRYLTFMSSSSLTGYDNHDAISGQPDEEVYLYDAVSNRLVCASCNPTGARPTGLLDDNSFERPMVDYVTAWGRPEHWLAAKIPGWRLDKGKVSGAAQYQQRFLSDSGRLFFDGIDSLVPQDTNGLADVYEYEPVGVGDCTSASVTFSERSGGCVSLISAGTSGSESGFMDASENGDDVFFVTASKLTSEDYDAGNDVYDAHACSSAVPCNVAPVGPPPCASGDSCKAAPSPQPALFGPAPSATFSGVGNVSEPVPAGVRPRSATRSRGLARALRACARKKKRGARSVCERRARQRYGASRRSRKANATQKGNR